MSLSANRWGGQCPSPPPSASDKAKLGLGCFSILAVPLLVISWLIFG